MLNDTDSQPIVAKRGQKCILPRAESDHGMLGMVTALIVQK